MGGGTLGKNLLWETGGLIIVILMGVAEIYKDYALYYISASVFVLLIVFILGGGFSALMAGGLASIVVVVQGAIPGIVDNIIITASLALTFILSNTGLIFNKIVLGISVTIIIMFVGYWLYSNYNYI